MPDQPPTRLRYPGLLIAAIIALAAVLRFWTIGSGLPYVVGADEPDIMVRVLHMLRSGDFNPHGFYDYPTLTFYMQVAVASARFLAGAMAGDWTNLDHVWPGDFYLCARGLTALLSVVTVYVVYRAGTRWGTLTAIVAALAMAVQPQLVREAHYALTDTPLTFFVAMTMLLSLCACETGRLRWFILAGAGAGLAAATKYNGGLAIIMPLAAILHVGALGGRSLALFGVLAGAAGAFVAGAPYSLLDLPGFLNGFAALMQHYNQERHGLEPSGSVYAKHVADWFSVSDPSGRHYRFTAWPAAALITIGAFNVATRAASGARLAQSLVLLLFPVTYFWFISNHSLVFARYAMPLLPAVCVAFGRGVELLWDAVPVWLLGTWTRRIARIALFLTLIPSALQAYWFDYDRRQVSTTELAAQWLVENVKPGEFVVIESMAMTLPPAVHAENTLRLISEPLEAYRNKGVTYLVSSSTETDKYFGNPAQYPGQLAAYKVLLQSTRLATRFAPIKDERPGPTWQVLRIEK
ncbi:MAG TPA: glycosyltransferase family 39 protein [Vicinamibacterales bacterium]|nr:glycosyltransferase family 39 protein [Vicinamibacterales bacterium]